jgi:hypothetical protein
MNANSKAFVIIVMNFFFLRNKCKEQIFFMAISEDVLEEDVQAPIVFVSPKPIDITPPLDPPKV